jgi:hypothetical protein
VGLLGSQRRGDQQTMHTDTFEVEPGRRGFSPMNAKWFADSAEGATDHGPLYMEKESSGSLKLTFRTIRPAFTDIQTWIVLDHLGVSIYLILMEFAHVQ